MKHRFDVNAKCLLDHGGKGQCRMCVVCRQWIKADRLDSECTGKP